MLLNPRQEAILRSVRDGDGERIEELCEQFGVSPATMRRDLLRLEEMGLVRRVRGGALPIAQDVTIPSPDDRETEYLAEKRRIGAAAAAMVADGSVIIIDAGTTTKQMVPHLLDKRDLTVITRDLRVAMELTPHTHIQCIFLGGTIQRSASTAGTLALRFLEQFYADQVFIGVLGISPSDGIWTSNAEESQVKLESMRRSHRRIILADSSKIGRSGGVLVTRAADADVLITDTEANPVLVQQLTQVGVEVKTV